MINEAINTLETHYAAMTRQCDGVFYEYSEKQIESVVKTLKLLADKNCLECALICIDGKDCDTAQKTKEATGMKYSEMCFNCYRLKQEEELKQ